jgi:hypothetical protein
MNKILTLLAVGLLSCVITASFLLGMPDVHELSFEKLDGMTAGELADFQFLARGAALACIGGAVYFYRRKKHDDK